MKSLHTDTPFEQDLPRLLRERGMSVRALARQIGISDSHLSRAIRRMDYKRASPDLIVKVAVALGLPADYFGETRERFVIEKIKADPKLRNELYRRLRNR